MTREDYIKLAREELCFPPVPEGFEGPLSFETMLTLEQALLAVERKPGDDDISEARSVVGRAAMKRLEMLEARWERVRELLDNFSSDPGKMLMMSFPAGTTPTVHDALCSLAHQIRYVINAKDPT